MIGKECSGVSHGAEEASLDRNFRRSEINGLVVASSLGDFDATHIWIEEPMHAH